MNNDSCSHLIYLFPKNSAFPASHYQKPYFPSFSSVFSKKCPVFQSFQSRWTPRKESWIKDTFLMCWSSKKKKSAIFITSILPYTNFGSVFILYQCIEYWINIQNIYSFMYQKMWLFYLFLKSSKALSVSLK